MLIDRITRLGNLAVWRHVHWHSRSVLHATSRRSLLH
jgi:hypothetical protein